MIENTAHEHSELLPIIKKYFENPLNYGFNITLIKTGSINETYKIIVNKKPYILQKLSNIFTKDVIEDMIQVTDYLDLNSIKAPHLLETLKGQKYVIEKDNIYRIYPFLYGETPDKFSLSNNDLKSLGIYLANLHKSLERLDYTPKHKIENFHNTEHYITKIKQIIKNNPNSYDDEDKELIEAMISVYDNLNKDFMSNSQQLIHGDPRIENILFDKKFNEYSIIDFDTIMSGSKFIDIGDLCRSLFISSDLDELSYSRKMHDKFIIGYYLTMVKNTQKVDRISKEDFMKQCVDATMLISLELAIRFYIDVVEDNYFGYNSEKFASRKEHNLVRAQNCYELFRIVHKDNY